MAFSTPPSTPWRHREISSRSTCRLSTPSQRRSSDHRPTNYRTFRSHSTPYQRSGASSCPVLGLSTLVARQRLLETIKHKIHEKEDSMNLTTEFRDPFALLLVLCALFRFADAAIRFARAESDQSWKDGAEGLFLVAAAVGNVLLTMIQKRRHHTEMAERVRVAVQQIQQKQAKSKDFTPSFRPSELQSTVLLPSNSYVACYRDNQWQRVPMNLLVQGDVVGLMSGDIAPGEVRLLQGMTTDEQEASIVYPRGYKLPPWTRKHGKETTRCTATFDPPLLLELCGGMRIFEMIETPVVQDIEDALFRINRPLTPTQKLQTQARLVAVYICTLYSVLVLAAIGLRVILQHRSLETTLVHILLGPMSVWLCFASLNTPLVLFIAEAAATASILGSFDDILIPKTNSNQQTTKMEQETSNNRPKGSNSGEKTSTFAAHTSRIDSAMATIWKATALMPTDLFDVEDRERLRSEKAQKQSAIMRSLHYFLVVLRFRVMRCDLAHLSDRRHLLVPFRSFRLLERLGNITMLCCLDDDILCEQTPSVEEIFLLNEKQNNNNSVVLDLHAERQCPTGLKFEDPKWKQHLALLKPIGLAIMVHDDENPAQSYEENLRYLVQEGLCAMENENDEEEDRATRDPYLKTCMQRLSAHIRMMPFPKHLRNLSREIGFSVADDLTIFQRQQSIHIICPRLAHHEHTNDHHDQNQEDTRYRGNLKSHMYSTVLLDKRSHRHQLLSRGHPTVVLAHCSEYWDGKSICPLTSDKQRAILDMYNQWRVEDLDCIAFSYVPVPPKLNHLFTRNGAHNSSHKDSVLDIPEDAQSRQKRGMLPPVYLVDDSTTTEVTSPQPRARQGSIPISSSILNEHQPGQMSKRHRHSIGPAASSSRASMSSTDDISVDQESISGTRTAKSMGALPSGHVTPVAKRRGHWTFSDFEPSIGLQPSDSSSGEESLLWRLQDDQIFLGMVASGVQPKLHTPDFIEDLNACGIRFVYFSPRNMRRSKLLAEKMGIETDWNCAISLRSLESDGPDPHRMTSNYSDWDVKARLPHGVEAIKRHLAEVDNVPLLVSLYTDSTPETISEMISIFQANHEVVMGVGSSLKESNAHLFSKADLGVALQGDVQALFDKPLPCGKELPVLSDEDIQFSQILNTLACAFRLKSTPDDVESQENEPRSDFTNTKDDAATSGTANVAHLIELIRLGRRMLTNFYQLNTFIFVSQLFLATIILVSYAVPFPHVPQLSCLSIFWLLWVFVPALSLSMLASASESDIMKKTPRKNEEFDMEENMPRLIAYFVGRHVPSVLLAIAVFECLLGFSLQASSTFDPHAFKSEKFHNFGWLEFVFDDELVTMRPRPAAVVAALDRAEAGMLLSIGICIVTSSCGYLYRCESVFKASPFRNIMWLTVATFLMCFQVLVSIFRAGIVGADGLTLWYFVTQSVPLAFWGTTLGLWPLVMFGVDELIKMHDRRHLIRYNKFLRMQFDTRLGMWSPK